MVFKALFVQGARVQWSKHAALSVASGDKGPKSERVQDGKGAKGPSSTGKGSRVKHPPEGYTLVRPYQLGNRSGKRSPVDERRAARMARPERGRARWSQGKGKAGTRL